MIQPFLVGEAVYLRPLEREDASAIAGFLNHPEVRRFILRHRPISLASELEFIDHLNKSEQAIVMAIALRDGDRLIGVTGLHEINSRDRSAMFGITIGVLEEQRRGRGTEVTRLVTEYAFDTLNLHRVWLGVFAENVGGIRAYEKVGYRREGVLRQAAFHDGHYDDVISMAILRDEFQRR